VDPLARRRPFQELGEGNRLWLLSRFACGLRWFGWLFGFTRSRLLFVSIGCAILHDSAPSVLRAGPSHIAHLHELDEADCEHPKGESDGDGEHYLGDALEVHGALRRFGRQQMVGYLALDPVDGGD
jgi:hypothetical protein